MTARGARYMGLLLALSAFLWSGKGCIGSKSDLVEKTRQGAIVAFNYTEAAKRVFLEFDSRAQAEIIAHASTKEEEQRDIAAYRAKRQIVMAAFSAVYATLDAITTILPAVQSGVSSEADLLRLLGTLASDGGKLRSAQEQILGRK